MQHHRNSEMLDALASIPLFTGIPARHLGELAHSTRRVGYDKGQTIFHVGDAARELFFLLSGQVKRATFSVGGNERVLELVAPGRHFGEAELFGPQLHASFAVAVEPSVLLCIGGDGVRRALEAVPLLSLRIIGALAGRALAVESDASASHFRTGCQRVLDYLLAQLATPLAPQGETTLTLAASKQLIASRIGITPETLSRVLRDLSDAGMIIVDGRNIHLQNACITRRLAETRPEQPVFPRRYGQRDGSGTASRRRRLVAAPTTPCGIINLAGRQRMLSQRLAKCWLQLGHGIQPGRSRNVLAQSAALFEEQMAVIATLAPNADVRSIQSRVGEIWNSYRRLLARDPEPKAARELFELNEILLAATDEITLAFEHAADSPHGRWVNLAGRQLMLSQRIAKFYLFQQWGIHVARSRAGLAEAMREFATALTELAVPARAVPEIEHQLERVSRHWQLLESTLGTAGPADEKRRATLVAAVSERLLRQTDAAVGLYEALSA
ncbi:type IV pili methyl-accepting chemotaxis transducer N-terminal domain-containing protein [Sulfurisoma sediminicola]|uniref:CRP-like cAMP-binding protein n=1 Tax=Sulfurisoma sediminicola TaxID=1381557 RepID=A0A497XFB4_9PROT|nr:type IV pili methyl-accepting chemotaxis transducer N-terminal domain-containing protein [Sulfurisoma sediminicola]RLJ64827.1 CRP-like cAMP-binding protein [Sulfurisoma sediminicola]